MVEFITLLLGLMIGPRTVELSAEPHVASIRLHMDGEYLATLDEGPPWRALVDLGPELRPHRLEAIAFDAEGKRVGRAQQILNYLRPSYAVSIALGDETPEGRRTGRLVWRAVLDQDPSRLQAHFDGRPLPIDERGGFVLPEHDLADPHVIEARAWFPDGTETRAELAFGGGLGEVLTSALSPLALRSPRGVPWTKQRLDGWIEHDDRPIGVFATRSAPRRVVMVRDIAANLAVRGFARRLERLSSRDDTWTGDTVETYLSYVSPLPIEGYPGTFELRDPPKARTDRAELGRALVGMFAVREADVEADARDEQQLWAALAVAGKRAASSRGPRAVFMMVDEGLDPGPPAPDHPGLGQTLAYLESLRVPVFVWAPTEQALVDLGLETAPPRVLHGLHGLRQIVREIDAELDAQTIVWVEGDVLPHEVELSDKVPAGVDWVR